MLYTGNVGYCHTRIYVHIIQITRVMLRMYPHNLRGFRYLTHIRYSVPVLHSYYSMWFSLCIIVVNTSWHDSCNISHLMPPLYI